MAVDLKMFVVAVVEQQSARKGGDIDGLRNRLSRLVNEAEDRGRSGVVYWHGRWLNYAEAHEALRIVNTSPAAEEGLTR